MITGNHAIGTVRKFPTLPLNANGVWIDPTGGVWRQASDAQNIQPGAVAANGKAEGNGAPPPPQLPLPDYERYLIFFIYPLSLSEVPSLALLCHHLILSLMCV